ncbi:MAG TPA: hypothetical protein VIL37_19225 [Natronosporangium sp.]
MRTPKRSDQPASPLPRSGDVLHVTRQASVQFSKPIYFRVIRVHDWPTYTGWIWLDGYQLNSAGDAVERRSIFVQADGLRRVSGPLGGNRAPRTGQANPRRPAPRSRQPRPDQ